MRNQAAVLLILTTLLSGCSMLRYQYGDRGRIESDHAPGRQTSATVEQLPSSPGDVRVSAIETDDTPLLTEDSMITASTVTPAAPTVPAADLPESPVSTSRIDVSSPAAPSAPSLGREDAAIISASNAMIAKSFSTIPGGSVVYVEKVVCDPPLVYKTDALTSSVEKSYASSGRYRMASPESVRKLRSNFEYQSVAKNGDWGNLASLARAEKYDYVFYGAIGEQNGKKLLTYYLIKVSTGEIVWENTRNVG